MHHQTIVHNHNIHHKSASKHASKCVLVVLFLLMVSFHQPALAQDDKTVYVEIFAGLEQPPIFDALMNLLETKIEEKGFSLSVFSGMVDERPENYTLAVNVHQQSAKASILFRTSRDGELSKSPILYPDDIGPLCCNGLKGFMFNTFSINADTMDGIASFIAGLGLYQVGDYEGCEQELSYAYGAVPPSSIDKSVNTIQSYINFYRANCAIMRDDLEMAMELLASSKPIGSVINLAWVYLQLGEIDKALELIKNLEAYNNWDLLARRAQLYNLAFRYDDAIIDLNTALELSPADPTLYTLRGQTYLLLYEWDAVLANYNKALELDPTYADAFYFRGILYYSILQTGQEMYTAALADFQRYLELAPDGAYAGEAARYADDIQTQINALNN